MTHQDLTQNISLKNLLQRWLIVPDSSDVQISGLSLNSKTVKAGDLFFAYPGTQQDGRRFIEEAIEKGAVAVIAEANISFSESTELVRENGEKVPLLTLPGLTTLCSDIAGEFYGNPSQHMQVVGITGTNGKTSCAYYLAAAFSELGIKSAIMGTIGCGVYGETLQDHGLTTSDSITIQATLADLYYQGIRFVAMEVSSHALAQHRVSGVHFDRAVFTNLSQDHLDYHGTMHEYWLAKKTLFENFNLQNAIINAKDQHGGELLMELWGTQYVCGYCQAPIPEEMEQIPMVCAHDMQFSREGIQARIETPWGLGILKSSQIGRYNLTNLLAVIATMGTMGVHIDDILQCVANLPVVPGRMQSVLLKDKPLVVIDYAHTPDALENVLSVLKEYGQGQLWCVFGCGGNRDTVKREIMGEIVERLADHAVVTDDNPRQESPDEIVQQILAGMHKPESVVVEHDRAKAIGYAIARAMASDTVLIAGKGHEAYQIIGEQRHHFSDLEQVEKFLNDKT